MSQAPSRRALARAPQDEGARKLAALSAGEIADRWGALKRQAAGIDDAIETLKAEFNRREQIFAKGEKFTVFKSVRSERRLDTSAIRAEMGTPWCAEHEREGTRTTYEVQPIPKG